MARSLSILVALFALVAVAFAFLPNLKDNSVNDDPMSKPCALCEFVSQAVEGYVSSSASEAEIFSFLDKACNLLPSPYNAQCAQVVANNGPSIIQSAIDKVNPAVLCESLKLCPAALAPLRWAAKFQPFHKRTVDLCPSCSMVVMSVESWLANGDNEAQIQSKLTSMCSKFPGAWGRECSRLASDVPKVIAWAQQKESAGTVCSQLGFCTGLHY